MRRCVLLCLTVSDTTHPPLSALYNIVRQKLWTVSLCDGSTESLIFRLTGANYRFMTLYGQKAGASTLKLLLVDINGSFSLTIQTPLTVTRAAHTNMSTVTRTLSQVWMCNYRTTWWMGLHILSTLPALSNKSL